MKLSKAIAKFLQDLSTSRSRATVTAYESDLNQLRGDIRPDTIFGFTPDAVREFFHRESARGMSMATLHRRMATLGEFSKWGLRLGLWNVDVMAQAFSKAERVRRPKSLPRPFAQDEVARIMALDLSPKESLVRALLLYTGLRVTPITEILIGHVSLEPPTIRAIVKGNKPQVIQMHVDLATMVAGYIAAQTDGRGQTFLITEHGMKVHRKHIERMTSSWGTKARVPDCTPHRFRHTFATELLRRGVPIPVIKDAMGHEDINSTMIYTQVTSAAVVEGIARLDWGAR